MPKKRCKIPKYLDALINSLIGVSDIKNKVGNNTPPNMEKITFDINNSLPKFIILIVLLIRF